MIEKKITMLGCPPNGIYPNNQHLPVCLFKQVFSPDLTNLVELFEYRFRENKWMPAWRNGLYTSHHFHSTAHEALGIYGGWVEVCFGGPQGKTAKVAAGDVVIIPAGVSHMNVDQSADFYVVGAYPVGQKWNMKYGDEKNYYQLLDEINKVELPKADPVYGVNGPLKEAWKL